MTEVDILSFNTNQEIQSHQLLRVFHRYHRPYDIHSTVILLPLFLVIRVNTGKMAKKEGFKVEECVVKAVRLVVIVGWKAVEYL